MLYPLMLLGLLGLVGPVLIHLIHRQKLQPRLLATIKFLDPGEVSNAFEPVPRDILQLILRLLVLLVLVLLMVRFTATSPRTGTRALTIILDQSMSMQRKLETGSTLFEQQKAEIAHLIEGMNEGDRFSLVLVGDTIAAETGFLSDQQQLRKALADFSVSEAGGTALVPAIKHALRQLQSRKELNIAVLVFSDHQRTNYDPLSDDGSLASVLESGTVKLLLMGQPLEDTGNVAVEEASFSPQRSYLGSGSKMTATVRNLTEGERNVEVYFREGDATGENRTLTLQPRETARIDLAHTFESPEDSACSVGMSEDLLPADNVFHAPMRMRDRRQVLVVAPPGKEEGGFRTSYAGVDLLTYALNPGEALGLGTGTYISAKKITPNLLPLVSLPLYSTIVIYALGQLPGETPAKDLAAYVENGGGLYFIPTGTVSPRQFNESFATLLSGFRLGGFKEPAASVFIDKNEASVTDPMLLPMMREEWGGIEDISFSRYFGVEGRGQAATVLQGSNGDVLAAVIRRGRGDVYVQTFSCEVEDSSMPRSTCFVPMIQEVIARLGAQGELVARDVVRVNEIFRMRLPELRALSGAIKLEGPVTCRFDLLPSEPGVVKVEGMTRAGNYRVSHPQKKGMRARWLAVDPVQGESDLTSVDQEQQARLLGTVNVKRLAYADLGAEFTRRHEVFALMIVLLLTVFIVEAVIGAAQSLRKGGGG